MYSGLTGMKQREVKEICIMRSFMIHAASHTSLGHHNERGLGGRDIRYIWREREMDTEFLQGNLKGRGRVEDKGDNKKFKD
jgi:hypothetical protein